jgi:hypothetical protein
MLSNVRNSRIKEIDAPSDSVSSRLAVMLLSDFQTLLGRHLGQSRSNLFGPEQCEAFGSEPLLGGSDQLLQRVIPGLAK